MRLVPGLGADVPPVEAGAFRRLWSANLVSQLGSEITLLALPLLVLTTLHGSTGAVGLVTAVGFLPWLVLALPAGVLADRRPRRPLLVAADLGRGAVLAVVPLAAWRGLLTLPLVLVLVLAAGCLTVVFDVAVQAYLPEVVARPRLGAANGALGSAAALAGFGGPIAGGALVGAIGAPAAISMDAASFVVSAALVAATRARVPALTVVGAPAPAGAQAGGPGRRGEELLAGVRLLWRTPPLRRLAVYTALFNTASNAVIPVLLVFLLRDAGLQPFTLGVVLAVATLGAVVGGLVSPVVSARLGIGRSLGAAAVVVAAGELLLAATPADGWAGPWVAVVMGVMFVANTAYNAQCATVRQGLAPPAVLGRLTAAYRLVVYVGIPVGAGAGGLLADVVGRRTTLVGLAIVIAAVTLVILGRPVRDLREPLDPYEQAPTPPAAAPTLA